MLEARNLRKRFGALEVTNNVSLRLEKGERRVILGPNGAGKTTLFNILAGELAPDAGSIRIAGVEATRLGVAARARLGLARSYQKNNLLSGLTVGENLGLAAAVAGRKTWSLIRDCLTDAVVRETVAEVAGQVGLEDVLAMPVDALAYGQRRQLEVGIALAGRPVVLLMDEPTSGVGPNMIDSFHKLVQRLPRDLTMLIIEHDMDLAFDVADRVTVLNYGEVVFEGEPQAARQSPIVREIYLGSWDGHA
ncbi:MAG: ATP-binding cassette domain-containing protein [Rhizobiales bacterium]|nr:ATP-binding cassette domain-containing protein [Hyphomicrobiales bacterium]